MYLITSEPTLGVRIVPARCVDTFQVNLARTTWHEVALESVQPQPVGCEEEAVDHSDQTSRC
eukprot:SAG31_NODE_6348_length_2052_cov_5.239424_3_plen_62_part_00